jgi:hypothetical protein
VIDNINSNTIFRLTFTAFLYIREFIYTTKEAADPITFITTKLTKSNIHFTEDYNYLILRLKQNKTDIKYKSISIIVAAIGNKACPVAALYILFQVNPQQPNAPLFHLNSGLFTQSPILQILTYQLELAGIQSSRYIGHSFHHSTSQHTYNSGISKLDI